MTTKVQLLVSEWCAPCRGAELVWQQVAERKAIDFEVLDVGQREGRAIVARLGVKTVPSTVIDGVLRHVGSPTLQHALDLVAAAADKSPGTRRYVGMTLASTSRWAISASVLYLALSGSALVFDGGIAGDPPWRAAALHAFGMGFLAFAIFGFGEHMLPRFAGAPIRGGSAAWTQQALAHAGTLLMLLGFTIESRALAFAGGALALASFGVYAVRLAPVLRHS
jgi:thiol-disulfide isomerase/thioredoxin